MALLSTASEIINTTNESDINSSFIQINETLNLSFEQLSNESVTNKTLNNESVANNSSINNETSDSNQTLNIENNSSTINNTTINETLSNETLSNETSSNSTTRATSGFTIQSTPGNINSCQPLNVSGTYTLTRNLNNSDVNLTGVLGCFNITAANVELNCQGYIIQNTSLSRRAIYSNQLNTTIRNCIITLASSNSAYGIYLENATNATIFNNTINFTGVGIYMTRGEKNNLTNNNISTTSSANNNYGIYLLASANNSIIGNNITTNGTTTNHGIYMQNNASGNYLALNTITIKGVGNSNYGIYLQTNSSYNQIDANIINTRANSTDNYGIFILTSTNNNLTNNNISTNGTSSNIGLYLSTVASNNILRNNSISANGTISNNYGMLIDYASHNNIIQKNTITTNGNGTNNVGIYIIRGSNSTYTLDNTVYTDGNGTNNWGIYATQTSNNNITNNNITTNGTSGNYGIYLLTQSWNNTITANTITTRGTATSNYGIYLATNISNTTVNYNIINTRGLLDSNIGIRSSVSPNISIFNNNISTNGTNNNYGIYIDTTSNNNSIINNSISANGTGRTGVSNIGIYLQARVHQTQVVNNLITTYGNGTSNFGIYANQGANETFIVGNTIKPSGNSTSNYGIYLIQSANNTIANNTILTNGTTTNIGIALNAHASNNLVMGNKISANGTGGSNFGIYVVTTSINNIIRDNVVYTNGTTNNYGIYLGTVNDNNFTNNSVRATGSNYGAFGLYISGSNRNQFFNNTFSTYAGARSGVTGGEGVWMDGSSSGNTLSFNRIMTNGTDAYNIGFYMTGSISGNLISNNTISTNGFSTNNYGFQIDTGSNANNITNNTIWTSGNSTDMGIVISVSNDNLISDNIILTNGSTSGSNYGIQLSGAQTTTVRNNKISVNGTSTNNFGVYIVTSANSNNITNNNISTYGSSTGYGVYIASSSINNLISANTISTNGTANANYGIYILTSSTNNIIAYNNVTASGSTTDNYGIRISNSNNNNVTSNRFSTLGSTTNLGAYIDNNANGNQLINNLIATRGSGANNWGVYLVTNNPTNNIIKDNKISTNGTTTNYGLYLLTSTYNTVHNNTITTNGTSDNYGIYLLTTANNNNITGNNISTGRTTNNHGIYISASSQNLIENNTISTNGTGNNHGIYIFSVSQNNIMNNNTIMTNGTMSHAFNFEASGGNTPTFNNLSNNQFFKVDGRDLNFSQEDINSTYLIDQSIRNFSFYRNGSVVYFKSTRFGEIKFLKNINSTGNNLSEIVQINYNSFFVNASVSNRSFNKSAEITAYNISTTLTRLAMFMDNIQCPSGICQNLTSLQAGNVTFNVTSWSINFSIQSLDPFPPAIFIYNLSNELNVSLRNLTFNFTVIDETSGQLNCSLNIDSILVQINTSVMNNTFTNLNATSVSGGSHYWNITCIDNGNNQNWSETRSFYVDLLAPNTTSIVFYPNETGYVDPMKNITINATVRDDRVSVTNVILQHHNGTGWNNATMLSQGNNVYQANVTLIGSEVNYTYNIWTNDTLGVSNQTLNRTISSTWDCTWNLSSNSLGQASGFNENKRIGNITIQNTGDAPYSVNNCSLSTRLTYDLAEGRICFDNNCLKPSNTYTVSANSNSTIAINISFLNEVKEESATINVSDVTNLNGITSPTMHSTNVTAVSTSGPYLYQAIESAPSSLNLTHANFSLAAYIRNLVGDGTINNTAYNVSFNWSLPSGFRLIEGNLSRTYGNLSNNSLHYNNLTLFFNETNLPSMGPGTFTIYSYTQGYQNNGTIITHSDNRTLLTETTSITLSCYGASDGIAVAVCETLDPDNPTASAGSGGSGGGGGGGASKEETKKENSFATFELVRGKNNEFSFEFLNKYDRLMKNIKIVASGIKSSYIKLRPDEINILEPKMSKNITVKITAPSYFPQGNYTIYFEIYGELTAENKTLSSTKVYEKKTATIIVLEIGREDALALLEKIKEQLRKMNSSNLNLESIKTLLQRAEINHKELNFADLKQIAEEADKIYENAFASLKLIEEIKSGISNAEKKGISAEETKKLFFLAETAFERGDYALALERLKEVKLTYALEVKGEFNLLYTIKNNPGGSLGLLAGAFIISFSSTFFVRYRLYKRKLRLLGEEEKLLLELMKVVQQECFVKNRMSMEEYEEAMKQYEIRLTQVIEERIHIETKIANLLKVEGKRKALSEEKKRLIDLIKKTQDDYLNKKTLETRIYDKMIKSYTSRMGDIEEQLTFIEANEALASNNPLRRILKVFKVIK